MRHSSDFTAVRPATPVISSLVFAGLPDLFRREVGERTVATAMRRAGVDLDVIEREACFVPHAVVIGFIDAAARATGEPDAGLLLAPLVSVTTYGLYGRYAMQAATLGEAIDRSIEGLLYHSAGDTMTLSTDGLEARFSYRFALAGHPGYAPVAPGIAGVLLSLCRAYTQPGWRPLRIELDTPRPRQPDRAEELFRCPVHYAAPAVTIVLRHGDLSLRGNRLGGPLITLADLARDRMGPAPRARFEVILEQIRIQVLGGSVSIEAAARAMDISIRSLQRELNQAGTDFRSLVRVERQRRATQLLRHGRTSITAIAADLGYASPANFTRAFRKATGTVPRDLRATGRI